MEINLDIGSGGKSTLSPLWIGVDPYVEEADVHAKMDNLPYETGTVDRIYSSHALEHIGRHEVAGTLREWNRVLKPKGELTLLVPDLEWCVKHWLSTKTLIGWNIDTIFGNQNHEGEYHKTGFVKETLYDYLRDAGFVINRIEYITTHGQQTIRAVAYKLEN